MQLNTNRYCLAKRPPRLPAAAGDISGYLAHGNPAQLVPWTPVMSDFINDITDEFLALLAFAKLTPSAGDTGQLLKAVQYLLYQPTILGGYATITQRDKIGNGGSLTLEGSAGGTTYPDINLDNYQGEFRVFVNGNPGLIFDPVAFTLSAMGLPAGQTARVGQVSTVSFVSYPDVNGNRVFYCVDATGKQTGHVLQDNAGVFHINTGASQEVTVDTSGSLTAPNIFVPEGAIKSFQALVGAADSGASIGTAGISTTGPILGTSQLNLYGRNVTLFNQAANPDGSHSITAQFLFNDLTPVTNGPQTEIWCENACLWLDSSGAAYIRASLGSPSAYGKITTTAASEEGLKTDVEPLTGGLAALQATPPIRFRYTEASGFDPAPVHVGAMYEAVRDAMPEAALFVGGHGQVDHTKTVPYHHAAILELAAENAALRDRMAALEARLPPQAA